MIRFTCLLLLLSQVSAFVVPQLNSNIGSISSSNNNIRTTTGTVTGPIFSTEDDFVDVVMPSTSNKRRGIVSSAFKRIKGSFTGIVTGLSCFVARGMAAGADDYEIAELPPPYVPALFGVVLLVGVGLLTSSLGNVMDEGTYYVWTLFLVLLF